MIKKEMGSFRKISLVCVSLLLLIFSGCSAGKKGETGKTLKDLPEDRFTLDESTPSWKLDKTSEPVELTWYVNADWWNTEWGNDTVTRKIKEDLNLEIKFITGDDTKLNTFFAGGKLPDIITIFDSNSSIAKSAAKWAWPLEDLADKYDPYFYNVASKDTLNWFRLDDGKTYGYPDYSNGQNVYDSGQLKATTAFTIRKDIYNELGQPKMETPKEFLSVLSEIKEKYPDLIPFGSNSMPDSTGSLGADLQNYIGVPIENKDGTWYDRNMDSDYLGWIKVLNEAYREGLISDDNFSDDSNLYEEKIKSGKYATIFIGGTPQRSGPLQVWRSKNPESEYIAIDGPVSSVGNEPTLSQSGLSGWMVNYITKDCTDPVKAIEIFTYLISDYGGELYRYGVEGETYRVNDDGLYELLPEVAEMKRTENDKFKKVYRLSEFIVFGNDKYEALTADVNESIAQMQEWGKGKLKPQFIIENISPAQGSLEARSLSAVDTNWNMTLTTLIRSQSDADFNAALEAHKEFRAKNNWDKIVAVYNENMNKNREKLTK